MLIISFRFYWFATIWSSFWGRHNEKINDFLLTHIIKYLSSFLSEAFLYSYSIGVHFGKYFFSSTSFWILWYVYPAISRNQSSSPLGSPWTNLLNRCTALSWGGQNVVKSSHFCTTIGHPSCCIFWVNFLNIPGLLVLRAVSNIPSQLYIVWRAPAW